MNKKLLIPVVSAVSLSFGGGCGDDEQNKTNYERACEKVESCNPSFFSSIDECVLDYRTGVKEDTRERVTQYDLNQKCYDAIIKYYDCYYGSYADNSECGYENYNCDSANYEAFYACDGYFSL